MTITKRFTFLLALGLLPAYAGNADDTPHWTTKDVSLMCHSRFGNDDRSHGYQECLNRNRWKVGRDEAPGEIDEINAVKNSGS